MKDSFAGELRRSRFAAGAAMLILAIFVFSQPVLAAGAKTGRPVNLAAVYGIAAAVSLILVLAYCVLVQKKERWLLLFFISVFVVNLGYLALSVSKTLEEALLANRIAYLGSAFLPLCMLMTIAKVCRRQPRVWQTAILVAASFAAFLLAASPGYLDWYYREASLIFVNGMAKLEKVYGPLHNLYMYYLVCYFGLMVAVIISSFLGKNQANPRYGTIFAVVVLLNLTIWFVERFLNSDFEFLAVSYIISELLILLVYGMMQENEAEPEKPANAAGDKNHGLPLSSERIEQIMRCWPAVQLLTVREQDVLLLLLQDKRRRDIAENLCVTENTVKKHTSNIFAKLSIACREDLFDKADRETPKE